MAPTGVATPVDTSSSSGEQLHGSDTVNSLLLAALPVKTTTLACTAVLAALHAGRPAQSTT